MIKNLTTAIFLGFVIYYGLFAIAIYLYPGGSDAFPDSTSFDMFHNYWCDIASIESKNCKPNPARPFALVAHLIIAGILICFSFVFTKYFKKEKKIHRFIQVCGVLMGISYAFVLTYFHNQALYLTALFGVFVFVSAFFELLKKEHLPVLSLFAVCAVLGCLCLYIYVTSWNLYYLPFLQKIMMVVFTVWVVWVTWLVRRKVEN